MTTLSLSIPQTGSPDSTEEPKIASDLSAIQSWANGNIDSTNLTAATSQAAGISTAGTKVKGSVLNAGPGTRTNTAYGALGDAADQVTGITLATNGLLRVWYYAQWQESVASAARAAIFIGANQLTVQATFPGFPYTQAAMTLSGTAAISVPILSSALGLVSATASAGFSADVTTGQAIGYASEQYGFELGGTDPRSTQGSSPGGPVDIFAAAGTYTIAVNYKSSSGTVTASNRHLYVQAISFG